jgi:hypothetical protein
MSIVKETISSESSAGPSQCAAERLKHAFDRLLAMLFILCIAVPLVGAWLHWDVAQPFDEKRQLATMPGWPTDGAQVKAFLPAFCSYYRDHFGFRDWLIQRQMEAQLGISGVSPSPLVAVGARGWLFWCPPSDADYAKYRGLAPFSESELDAWQKMFEGRNARLAANHIQFLVVFVPDKQTIYPEFMPESKKIVRNVSRLDQLMDRLQKTNPTLAVLDLRAELIRAKPGEQLYYKADTHWTQFGAYVGYRAIMNEVTRVLPGKHIVTMGPLSFQRSVEQRTGGDLTDIVGVSEEYKEQLMTMTPLVQVLVPAGPHDGHIAEIVLDNDDRQLPRLVMFRDSFATALIPLMARSFSHGVYRWSYNFDPNLIARQKPDLVISEFTERALYDAPPF